MKVELEVLQQQLGKKGRAITQDTVDELNQLIEDPDYGEEFLDQYISYFNVMEKESLWTTPKYMNAMKFFCLIESGHNQLEAYVKVFPDRLQARLDRGEKKSDMGGEASRFNSSQLVNEIRKVATVPVQLIHRNILHKAIMKSAQLMNDPGVSPAVQQKAAEVLIRELKPTEDSNVNIKIGMSEEAKSQQARLLDHIGQIALQQQQMLASGMKIEDIQRLNVQISKEAVLDVEVEDE